MTVCQAASQMPGNCSAAISGSKKTSWIRPQSAARAMTTTVRMPTP
jgi:hypothetical protein